MSGSTLKFIGGFGPMQWPSEAPTLCEGVEFGPELSRTFMTLERSYPPRKYDELKSDGNVLMRETKTVVRSLHVAIRLCFEGDVGIDYEEVRFPDETDRRNEIWRPPYTVAWSPEPCVVDQSSLERLRALLACINIAESNQLVEIDMFTRFAQTVFRYYLNDRFVDSVICLDGILIPEGNSGREKFASRGAKLLTESFESQKSAHKTLVNWYKLRNAILHGDEPGQYKHLWPQDDRKKKELCLRAEQATREALRWMLHEDLLDRQKRKDKIIEKLNCDEKYES